ncbi:putative ama1 protein [Leptomonas pyrrhocoris]|uniref:Putative ama1 protein n=1 Tax=Leptomonas pyrrhocoris TaxID=157538 RepID=A0A0N1J541_LEPPY|nr:putative ama1 protein [Leptomonas pyrrhocoris]KPA83164.1 putative ama1 protein [Leptomonas pyrrhocoris]|eukprot:XP_015661603.1 putative ama1 protein [Leptomonas pyrrhocoris]
MSQHASPVFTKPADYYPPSDAQEDLDERLVNVADALPPPPPTGASQPQRSRNVPDQYSPSSSPPTQRNAGAPASRYAATNDIPVNLTATKFRHRPWHYSLCVSCKEMDSCAEACCCLYCQLSRQCNMFVANKREIHWPYCLLMTFTDLCALHMLVTWIFASETRRMARERYGISGSCFSDCCVGCWCRSCTTQQVLLEMTVMNDFPGATCYNAVPQPMEFEMV